MVTALDAAGNRANGPSAQIQMPDFEVPQWPGNAAMNVVDATVDEVASVDTGACFTSSARGCFVSR